MESPILMRCPLKTLLQLLMKACEKLMFLINWILTLSKTKMDNISHKYMEAIIIQLH
jgi:hypothetical protein